MALVKVLVKGYVRALGGVYSTSSTVVLIRDNGKNVVVDPGINRNRLLTALSKAGLRTSDVDYVVLTHMHVDHCLLAGVFENAKLVDGEYLYTWAGKMKKHKGIIPGTTVRLVKTPGHDQYHCAVIVKDNMGKTVVVAGDNFWWADGEVQNRNKKDPYVDNESELRKSRELIIRISDFIIPGHGKVFRK